MGSEKDLLPLFESRAFSAHALGALATQADSIANPTFPAALFVLMFVAERVADLWDGPVTVSEAADCERQFGPPLRELLEALAEGQNNRVATSADNLALAYWNWGRD